MQLIGNRPQPGVLYGITHELDGSLIIREPKILKVGIGWPKGPALNVWRQKQPDGSIKWHLMKGYAKDARIQIVATREEAEAMFDKHFKTAPVCPYPRKVSYFNFTRPVLDEGSERMVPDFEAIEAHDPTPNEIDVIMIDDEPFNGGYQMWSASELRCKGDGLNGLRVLSMASTADEKELAKRAAADGERFFPIIGGCWTAGCPYSKPGMNNGKETPSLCKPGADLRFQLAYNLRVGGTAYFHTTGIRSIQQIFSSLHCIKNLTGGRLGGVPLKMVMRPYKTNHNNQPATQFGVSLEFRAPNVEAMHKRLMESVFDMRRLVDQKPVRMLESAGAAAGQIDEGEDTEVVSAQAMTDEFYPEAEAEDAEFEAVSTPAQESPKQPEQPATQAAKATTEKTAGLAEKIRSRKAEPAPAPVVTPVATAPVPVAPAPAAPVEPAASSKDDLF